MANATVQNVELSTTQLRALARVVRHLAGEIGFYAGEWGGSVESELIRDKAKEIECAAKVIERGSVEREYMQSCRQFVAMFPPALGFDEPCMEAVIGSNDGELAKLYSNGARGE